jgi:hypothetical protein
MVGAGNPVFPIGVIEPDTEKTNNLALFATLFGRHRTRLPSGEKDSRSYKNYTLGVQGRSIAKRQRFLKVWKFPIF